MLCWRLSLDRRPILIGPWRSEVGFEGLYWLPWLQWVAKRVPQFWERAVVVSRGGGANLYGRHNPPPQPPVGHYAPKGTAAPVTWWQPTAVDLYSLRSVTDVRRQNLLDWSQTKLQKQTRVMPWDVALLKEAAVKAGVTGRYHVLHPAWMYWALAPFWDEERGLKYLLSAADYTPLPKPVPPVTIDGLPERYVAVKFYGRATWPHPHPDTTGFVAHVIQALVSHTPVVLLNSGHDGDEHTEMSVVGPNVFALPNLPAEVNLGVQLSVLGRATAFVGTYGGVSQTALRMGVPSASFWHQFGGTAHAHLSLSSYLSKRTNVSFVTGSLDDANVWRQMLVLPQGASGSSAAKPAVQTLEPVTV
jgi:hypothetical protein